MLYPRSRPTAREARVVITGAGIITGLGQGWAANEKGFRAGVVARRPVTLFEVSRQRVKEAAEVVFSEPLFLPGVSPASQPPGCSDHPPSVDASSRPGWQSCEASGLEAGAATNTIPQWRREGRRMDRAARMLLWAALEAWNQCGWEPAEHLPIVLGTTSGEMKAGEDYYRQTTAPPHSRRRQASRVLHYQAQRQGLEMAAALGAGGPLTFIANACASGANAIGHGFDLVRSGHSPRVLAGGYEALSQLVFAGFDSLQALSPTRCRPFDAGRDGLALGEGAAILALETFDSARQRGAQILGELAGYGASTDRHHLTQPQPEGNAAFASMSAACLSADVTPEQIDYLNAHGTGTPLNDSAEAAAINRWAGARAATLPVSSTKSSVGHLLGAAGAVEAVVCLMALRGQWLPPTTTLEKPDPVCLFPLVQQARDARIEYVLSNSFGFGGANASLILRRWA